MQAHACHIITETASDSILSVTFKSLLFIFLYINKQYYSQI